MRSGIMEITSADETVYIMEIIDQLHGRIIDYTNRSTELNELLSSIGIELANIQIYKNLNTIELEFDDLIHFGYRYQMFLKEYKGQTEVLFSGKIVSIEDVHLMHSDIYKEEFLKSYRDILTILVN